MKCIYCSTDSTFRERSDGTCKKCHRPFAFEPKTMDKLFTVTDKAFLSAIEAVSDKGMLFFTSRQLYYQVVRKRREVVNNKRRSRGFIKTLLFMAGVAAIIFSFQKGVPADAITVARAGGGSLMLSVILGSIFIPATGIFLFLATGLFGLVNSSTKNFQTSLIVAGVFLALGWLLCLLVGSAKKPKTRKKQKLYKPAPISYQYFEFTLLDRWIKVHGVPPKMLPTGGRLRPALREQPEPDIRQYSFDRVLVVDNPETADMLLANNLHFETNMPILTIGGYPQDVFDSVMQMLRRNPNLKVFALHDANVRGCLMPLQLRENPRWFPQPNISVIDLGLRPRQLASMPEYVVYKGNRLETLPPEVSRSLLPGERRWLQAGFSAELTAMRPAQLMKIIYRMLQRSAEEESRIRQAALQDPRSFFQTRLPGMPLLAREPGVVPSPPPPSTPGDGWPTPPNNPTGRS